MRPAATIFALGFAVALAGDACHVASGATRHEWEDVPEIWHSQAWFPFLVAIRDWLIANDGRPVGQRRAVTDRDESSLLSRAALTAREDGETARAARPRRRRR